MGGKKKKAREEKCFKEKSPEAANQYQEGENRVRERERESYNVITLKEPIVIGWLR